MAKIITEVLEFTQPTEVLDDFTQPFDNRRLIMTSNTSNYRFLSVSIPNPKNMEETHAKAIPIHRIDSFEGAQMFPGEDHPNNNVLRIYYTEHGEQKMINCCSFQVGNEMHKVMGKSSLDVVMLASLLKA